MNFIFALFYWFHFLVPTQITLMLDLLFLSPISLIFLWNPTYLFIFLPL